MERDELVYEPARPRDYLCVGAAPESRVAHHHLAELEAGLPPVCLVVEDMVKRMVRGAFLAAIGQSAIEEQRELGQSFGQDADAGIDGADGEGG